MNKDLTGQRFGRLTVVGSAPATRGRHLQWRCSCDCGRETTSTSYKLTSGYKKSCGCLTRESARDRHYKHGGKGTRLYNIWKNARQRCRNPKNPDYKKWYGSRGIQFAKEWDDFGAFREWALANGYNERLTLDRIDPNGDYAPSNCRWATAKEQRQNQRRREGVMP